MEMEMDRFDISSYIWHQFQDLNEVDGVKRAHFDQSEKFKLIHLTSWWQGGSWERTVVEDGGESARGGGGFGFQSTRRKNLHEEGR